MKMYIRGLRLGLKGREKTKPQIDLAKKRLDVFYDLTYPIISYYAKRGVVTRIDCTEPQQTVKDKALEALN